MRLSHDKIIHMSHLIIDALENDENAEFKEDKNEIRNEIVRIIIQELKKDEELEDRARQRIRAMQKNIPEGGQEWDVLFRKYYEEEMGKHRKVKE
ncbi:hypothetical protein CEE39_02625 [bacterium (candidate division B38) B3_B38]|nr:MAG: hypothetical protein CEE39_02625 [bacterium (candidate division B38) B3_B38]